MISFEENKSIDSFCSVFALENFPIAFMILSCDVLWKHTKLLTEPNFTRNNFIFILKTIWNPSVIKWQRKTMGLTPFDERFEHSQYHFLSTMKSFQSLHTIYFSRSLPRPSHAAKLSSTSSIMAKVFFSSHMHAALGVEVRLVFVYLWCVSACEWEKVRMYEKRNAWSDWIAILHICVFCWRRN